ncbi:TrbC/VirB2 family protein [Herbaspirillum sp. SJZ107]|uniref:TrbC/VirB2 family protein n=1 Tax=Herbaspirillum sp. SJZ107 TaxID=2572881 RepID=UPI00114E9752|nr:TrbC/VirB2 family protein [Herbaspirillum sp. SJZ107]TQK03405.1 type IV secretion system protein VirB2 [Herbaspirillum sp. SJZ107]
MKTARTLQLVLSGAVVACSLFPELAFAAPPFANSGTTLKTDLVQTLTPFAGIAVLVVGVLCLMGRVNWGWFVGGLVGIAMMFGSDQIVSWFRTLMGV